MNKRVIFLIGLCLIVVLLVPGARIGLANHLAISSERLSLFAKGDRVIVADQAEETFVYLPYIENNFQELSIPGDFSKQTPTDGATDQPISLTLEWGNSSGAADYEYCYDTTNDNACSNWISSGATSQASITGLSLNTTYYWQVRATNAAGTTYANGSPTAYWSFTTQAAITQPPGDFNKLTPTNGVTNQPTSLILDWGDSSGATSYAYCYDTSNDNACSGWTSTGATSQASITGLSLNTTYYWQVWATNASGTTYADGSSTDYWSFTTAGDVEEPEGMILIPAGEFQMGCHPDHNGGFSCWSDELPLHTVYLDAY
jgi:hypothetical protein